MFKINNKDTRATPLPSFWCLCCQLWTYFTPCSSVSIVKFEQVNAGWEDRSETLVTSSFELKSLAFFITSEDFSSVTAKNGCLLNTYNKPKENWQITQELMWI